MNTGWGVSEEPWIKGKGGRKTRSRHGEVVPGRCGGITFPASEGEDECVGEGHVGNAIVGGRPTDEGDEQSRREEPR